MYRCLNLAFVRLVIDDVSPSTTTYQQRQDVAQGATAAARARPIGLRVTEHVFFFFLKNQPVFLLIVFIFVFSFFCRLRGAFLPGKMRAPDEPESCALSMSMND